MKFKDLMTEGASIGCLALSGLAAPVAGAGLAGLGAFLPALRNAVADKDKAAVEDVVKRIANRARRELELFKRPIDDDAWEAMVEANDARYIIIEHLGRALPGPQRFAEQASDLDELATETLSRLNTLSEGRLDLEDGSHAASVAGDYVRAFLAALSEEREFLERALPFMAQETLKSVHRVEARTERIESKLDALADKVAAEKHVPVETLRSVARIFDQSLKGEYDAQDLIDFLTDKALKYRDLTTRIDRGSNIAPELGALREQAQAKLDAGDFDAAEGLLDEALDRQAAALDALQAELTQGRAERVELLIDRAKAAEFALNYAAAGEAYLQAVDLLKQDAPDAAAELAFKAANGLGLDAQRLGDNAGLTDAIALYEARLELKPKSNDPSDWAMTQNNLGIVLRVLGQRRGDEETLRRAVDAYDAALTVYTPDAAPVDWARTQNNLGAVLQVLGERRGDEETLLRAVDAYDAALTVRTWGANPVAWAMTQNNLGNVLSLLGQRRGDETTLQRAVDAYNAALTVYTSDAAQVDWAMTQNNLGNVLSVLGQRSGDEATLQRAVDAYDAALTVRTPDAAPVDWAMTQGNLGNVLSVLGQRRGDEATLQRAVDAYDAALTVYTPDAAPVDWAMTQNNLGAVLQVLGERRGDETILQRAVEAHAAALGMFESVGHTAYAEVARGNRDRAQAALDRLRGGGG